MTSTRRNTVFSLVCALALGGVAGTAQAGTAPCALLTPAQISAALGQTFGPGQPIGTTGCSWTSPKPHLIVTVSLWPPTEWDRMKSSPMPGTTTSPAGGVGDDSFYATIAQYTVLYVKKGATVYLFKVYGVEDKARQMSVEMTLAQQAMTNA